MEMLQEELKKKDEYIKELEAKISTLIIEKDELIDSFQISTEVLLNRIKDLEAISNSGERPQTAQIINHLPPDAGRKDIDAKLHNSDSNEVSVCPNCNEQINESELTKHSIICFRKTSRCKACGEKIEAKQKKEHLNLWRNIETIEKSLKEDDEKKLNLSIEHGISPNLILDKTTEQSIIHASINLNAKNCLQLLLTKGANIEACDKEGKTPLISAIHKRNYDFLQALIELGANIESKDKTSKTPIMHCCMMGEKKCLEILIKYKANVNAITIFGDTALSIAQKNGYHELVAILSKNGASIKPKKLGMPNSSNLKSFEIINKK